MPGPLEARHGADAGRGGAVEHIDGGHFAFGLQEDAAGVRQVERGSFGDLAGRRDGIAVESAASGEDGGLYDGFIALDQLFCHGRDLLRRRQAPGENPDAARFGQTKKQSPQPVQPWPAYSAGW